MNAFLPLLHRYTRSSEKTELEDFLSVSLGALLASDPNFGHALLQAVAKLPAEARWELQRRQLDEWLVQGGTVEVLPQEPAYSGEGAYQGRTDLLLRLRSPGVPGLLIVIEAKVRAGRVELDQLRKYEAAYPPALFVALVGRSGGAPAGYPCLLWRDVAALADAHRAGACSVLAAGLAEVLIEQEEADPWLGHTNDDWNALNTFFSGVKSIRGAFRDALVSLFAAKRRGKVFEAIDIENDAVRPTEGFGVGFAKQLAGEQVRGATLGASPDSRGGGLSWILEIQVGRRWVGGRVLRAPWRKLRGEDPAWYAAELGDCSLGSTDLRSHLGEACRRARSLLADVRGSDLDGEAPEFEVTGDVAQAMVSRALRAQDRIERALYDECRCAVRDATGKEPESYQNSRRTWVLVALLHVGCNVVLEDRIASAWVWLRHKPHRAAVLEAMTASATQHPGVVVTADGSSITAVVALTAELVAPGKVQVVLAELLRAGIAAAPFE